MIRKGTKSSAISAMPFSPWGSTAMRQLPMSTCWTRLPFACVILPLTHSFAHRAQELGGQEIKLPGKDFPAALVAAVLIHNELKSISLCFVCWSLFLSGSVVASKSENFTLLLHSALTDTSFNLIVCYFALGDREKMRKGFSRLVSLRAASTQDDERYLNLQVCPFADSTTSPPSPLLFRP